MSDYERIARAIDYIVANAAGQPGLAEVAAAANMSPFHFQRLFVRWAGISPKRFLQVVTVERAKRLLADVERPLLSASDALGLSGASRLHDHFVRLEAVTPGEFRSGGCGLSVRFGVASCPFGSAFVAFTDRGITALTFVDDTDAAAERAREAVARDWPAARLIEDQPRAEAMIERVFRRGAGAGDSLAVYVRGTNFQVAVWRALLRIPEGRLVSYGDIALAIGRPRAVRAVGSAVGANPCAFLIPCHRVIRGNGELGGYRWGLTRKHAIHAWEAAASDGMLPAC